MTREQAAQADRREFIQEQDMPCITCQRTSEMDVQYLEYVSLDVDGTWHLACAYDATHTYIVRVAERETADDLDTITMTFEGSWLQFRFSPSKKE